VLAAQRHYSIYGTCVWAARRASRTMAHSWVACGLAVAERLGPSAGPTPQPLSRRHCPNMTSPLTTQLRMAATICTAVYMLVANTISCSDTFCRTPPVSAIRQYIHPQPLQIHKYGMMRSVQRHADGSDKSPPKSCIAYESVRFLQPSTANCVN
jgi:hypothetical protein